MKHAILDEIFGPCWIARPLPGGEAWPRAEAYPRCLYERISGEGVAIPDVPKPYLRAIRLYEADPVGNARYPPRNAADPHRLRSSRNRGEDPRLGRNRGVSEAPAPPPEERLQHERRRSSIGLDP